MVACHSPSSCRPALERQQRRGHGDSVGEVAEQQQHRAGGEQQQQLQLLFVSILSLSTIITISGGQGSQTITIINSSRCGCRRRGAGGGR